MKHLSLDFYLDFLFLNLETFTIDQAVEAMGFGRFQIKLSLLTGLAWVI